MKNIFIIIAFLFLTSSFCQSKYRYNYYLYLNDYKQSPTFDKEDELLYYNGKNQGLKEIFDKYEVYTFRQAFPEFVKSDKILNVFLLQTNSQNLVQELLNKFPNSFLSFDDLTNQCIQPLNYYPNDYGTTHSPNLGTAISRKDLDYSGAPKAWDIEKGNSNIVIGISDIGGYNSTAEDFVGKLNFIQEDPYNYSDEYSHATDVTAIAAARGDNAHGSVGVCMDCNILAADYGAEGSLVDMAFNNLYRLAIQGARVINMSWHNGAGYGNIHNGYRQGEQDIINYLVNEFHVIFVASAGNMPSFSTTESYLNGPPYSAVGVPTTPFGILYTYPASYDNVISVSGINQANSISLPLVEDTAHAYCCTSPLFSLYSEFEDSVSKWINGQDVNNPVGVIRNGNYINTANPDGFSEGTTLNDKVDILSTAYGCSSYSGILTGGELYTSGTSFAAPMVTGTIGLMLSVNECLNPTEVETILKVTAKDIESMPLNQAFTPAHQPLYPGILGYLGAGKLEIGNAVEFTAEMKKKKGNARIENHVFNRFNFNLEKINNQLSIQNVTFKDNNISDFTAKNSIEVFEDSDFKPNSSGYVDLKIDGNLVITCTPIVFVKNSNNNVKEKIDTKTISTLYPNPNNGDFTITLGKQIKGDVNIAIYDLYGKLVYKGIQNQSVFNLSVSGLASGLYVVKLKSSNYEEVLKLIKK